MIQKRELLHIWKELDINQNKYTMDKEDYVSLKVAKLLKEKGFDEYCEAYYHLCCDDATEEECFEKSSDKDFKNCNNKFRVGSPTLYEAQKWLRKTYNIDVLPIIRQESLKKDYCCYIYKDAKVISCKVAYGEDLYECINDSLIEALKYI